MVLTVAAATLLALAAWAQTPYPRAGWVAEILPGLHDVEAIVTIVDAHTLQVEHFTYDGTGPLVYFYLGASNDDAAFHDGLQLEPELDRPYDDESLTLTLPQGETLDGYNAIAVWCVFFGVNFGSASFVPPQVATPAISSWGLLVLALLTLIVGTALIRARASDRRGLPDRGGR